MSTAFQPGVASDAPTPIALRRFSAVFPRVVVVAASTGGPQALTAFLRRLAPSLGQVPVVIVLHMPPDFVAPMSADMARLTGLPSSVARHGAVLRGGHLHFAAGPTHCRLATLGDETILVHSDTPPENFCKPAADVLFRSAAETFGRAALGVVLSGMGFDGLLGAQAIVGAGGSIVAQDEASSVVWGMPGAVARAGLCSAVTPIDELARVVALRLRGSLTWGLA